MDNLDDSENAAKISDSAYSNSCSNSQSRRSHSSKSTHSGSNSSGSSGYGGKPPSGCSNNVGQQQKKEKDPKKKKQTPAVTSVTEEQAKTECVPPEPELINELAPPKEILDVIEKPSPDETDTGQEKVDVPAPERTIEETVIQQPSTAAMNAIHRTVIMYSSPSGFSCVISMHDGVVMYTTSTLTTTLGFPKDMWIGRSFIQFLHPWDRNAFASQITNGLAIPKNDGAQTKVQTLTNPESKIVCRVREYRGLSTRFGVKDLQVSYTPFLLKLTLKNVNDEDGKLTYLVIRATPMYSAFKVPNEILTKPVSFVLRHAANGNLEYIDLESVPFLGHLPQDLIDKDALRLYHPDDLGYLGQVYETIVKEGSVPLSNRSFRMMTQNCGYVKVETEWSSFINPWSKKLEFVIGKHHIIEGPFHPDVFEAPPAEKATLFSDAQSSNVQALRDDIIRIMNEVTTKPAEAAKQQMTKKCQDLANFMESLMEEPVRTDEELRFEIQEPDHSYYFNDQEPDSVMLGGISPHHDYNDGKSSVETPLSYTQINYNETLHRYFENHQPYSFDEYKTAAGENILGLDRSKEVARPCLSPMADNSGVSGIITNSSDSYIMLNDQTESETEQVSAYPPVRLTESLLAKHNSVMERKLLRSHREGRPSSKGEREIATSHNMQKKKEHLARCNASFHPTMATAPPTETKFVHPHGKKRSSHQSSYESVPSKQHCPAPRCRRYETNSAPIPPASSTVTSHNHWNAPPNHGHNMNPYLHPAPLPPPMPIMNQMPNMQGMYPMYYGPQPGPSGSKPQPNIAEMPNPGPHQQFQMPAMPCMMYGQTMYGHTFMYPSMSPQVTYPIPTGQNMFPPSQNQLELTSSNYEEACKVTIPKKTSKFAGIWNLKKRDQCQPVLSKNNQGSGESSSSHSALNRSTEAAADTIRSCDDKSKTDRLGNSDEQVDRTDVGSSYSSFYSSFFKTESGSAEESSDARRGEVNQGTKKKLRFWDHNRAEGSGTSRWRYTSTPNPEARIAKAPRRVEPPWMEMVNDTPDLIYKYQVPPQCMNEVLMADKRKIDAYSQPNLVNDQLNQLYSDLKLQGEAPRLTIEEGITSSGSSSEDYTADASAVPRRKRHFSKMVMIYEEDAPLPPPSDVAG